MFLGVMGGDRTGDVFFGPGFSPRVCALVPASSLFAARLLPTAAVSYLGHIEFTRSYSENAKVLTHNLNLQFIYLI
jgi:hypothetical protein